MATIIRQAGFRVVIFENDHAPSHVHVFKAGTEAIIELQPVQVRAVYRMSKVDLRKAFALVEANLERLTAAWNSTHDID